MGTGGMANTANHSVSVTGIVVNHAGQVLVIQRRDNGHWEPPGGVLEPTESFEQGVRREVLEETGVHVEVSHLTGVYKNLCRSIVALVFRCAPLNEPDPHSVEAVTIRWVNPDTAADLMDPAYAVRVTDAFGSAAVTRAHNGVDLMNA